MHQIRLTTPTGNSEISVGQELSAGLSNLERKPVLLVDEHVLCQHYDLFCPFPCITVPAGEQFKTLETVEKMYKELVELEADRSSLIIGVGGGVATDIAGFVAATYLREVQFGFISTTLLGQVDASIGGKNGVNLDGYKNMIGTIRQPEFVWCDLSLLVTLARKEYVSGIAEVIKYGAIRDAGFLDYLQEHMPALLKQEGPVLERVVTTSAAIKVEIVEKDEKEFGLRRLLNFGHTIGHAIERSKKVLHGEAVAAGMVLAARLSHARGLLPATAVDMISDLLVSAGLPAEMELDPYEIYHNIRKDKKKSGESIHFILLEGVGNAIVQTFPYSELKSVIHDLC
jgi:3-dehydroquinate synthase